MICFLWCGHCRCTAGCLPCAITSACNHTHHRRRRSRYTAHGKLAYAYKGGRALVRSTNASLCTKQPCIKTALHQTALHTATCDIVFCIIVCGNPNHKPAGLARLLFNCADPCVSSGCQFACMRARLPLYLSMIVARLPNLSVCVSVTSSGPQQMNGDVCSYREGGHNSECSPQPT